MKFELYNQLKAVEYAHLWAYSHNPAFYNYEFLGGDCTNFISQCLYAGCGVMNYMPTFGWYYIDANRKSPSWTGVKFLQQFLLRPEHSIGPVGIEVSKKDLEIGDVIQLSFDGIHFSHSLIVVSIFNSYFGKEYFVAAHSDAADHRPLYTYRFRKIRYIHIEGFYMDTVGGG